jgi:tetratricopeptide (TPR) repeat protein
VRALTFLGRGCNRFLLFVALSGFFWLPSASAQGGPATATPEFQTAVQHFRNQAYSPAIHILEKLEHRYPEDLDVHLLMAICLDLSGEAEEAGLHFEKAVEIDPNSSMARVNLGTNLLRREQTDRSRAEFERALELDPNSVTASFNLGTIHLRGEDFQKALPYLETAYRLQPDVYENGYQLAFCQFALGDHIGASHTLESLEPVPANRLEFHLLRAVTWKALGKEERVTESMQAMLDRMGSGEGPNPFQQIASLLISQQMFADAERILDRAVHLFPNSYPVLFSLARVELQTGRLNHALTHARRALAEQETAESHALMADILEASDKPVEALEHYEAAARMDPSEENLFAFGYQFLSHWNWDAARVVFEKALKEYPDSWRLWLGLGSAHLGGLRHPEAAEAFLKATEVSGDELLGYRFLSETIEWVPEILDKAVERFEALYRRRPDDPWARYFYARALYLRDAGEGDSALSEECERLLKQVVRERPDLFDPFYFLGRVYFDQKRWDEAIPLLRRAAELDPDHAEVLYRLALSLQRNGETEEAQNVLARFQDLSDLQSQAIEDRIARTKTFVLEMGKNDPE